MSRRTRVNTARPRHRQQGRRRIGAIALIGAGAVAIAAASAWMTVSASPAMKKSTPVAQTEPQRAPAPAPVASATPAAAPADQATTAPQPAAQQAAPAPSASTAMPAQQAHIDPKTGQLRPTEHDDAATMAAPGGARRLSRAAQSQPQEFFTDSGAVGVAVPDELHAYTVATKTANGKIVIEHAQGGKAAEDRVKQNASKTGLSHRKEEPNDR